MSSRARRKGSRARNLRRALGFKTQVRDPRGWRVIHQPGKRTTGRTLTSRSVVCFRSPAMYSAWPAPAQPDRGQAPGRRKDARAVVIDLRPSIHEQRARFSLNSKDASWADQHVINVEGAAVETFGGDVVQDGVAKRSQVVEQVADFALAANAQFKPPELRRDPTPSPHPRRAEHHGKRGPQPGRKRLAAPTHEQLGGGDAPEGEADYNGRKMPAEQ